MKSDQLPDRSEIPLEETWNLESIYGSVEVWQEAIQIGEQLIPDLKAYQGILADNPHVLLSFLQLRNKSFRLAEKVRVYGMLASSVDSADQEAQARAVQGANFFTKIYAAAAFAEPEIMQIGWNTLQEWCAQNAELKIYSHYFKRLEERSTHVRSGEVEEVLALTSEPLGIPAYTHNVLTNADLKFKPAENQNGEKTTIGQSNANALINHQDRHIRKTAWENYADGYLTLKNSLAILQLGGIQRDVLNMKVRGYESSLQASMEPNQIPTSVFYNLLDVFKANLPTWHRYWRLRRKILGYDSFHVYDIKAPLGSNSPIVPYQQAIEWIAEGMRPLGDAYVETLKRGSTIDRWVDRAVNQGKRQGAFSGGAYDTHPFVMMSYNNDVFSLSTLAHELGHSMHSHLTRKNQPYVYGRYSLFLAEVASNFNQAMVRNYLFENQPDPDFQLALIEETMSNFHRYFFIMPTLARWELAMHELVEQGKSINANIMIDTCAALFKEGYGEEVVFDHDRIGITWAQFNHMYMNFYVYQYATGISAANALVERVMGGGKPAVEDYLNFLRAGSSQYPLAVLKEAGVDMSSPEPVEKAFAYLSQVIDRLEEITS